MESTRSGLDKLEMLDIYGGEGSWTLPGLALKPGVSVKETACDSEDGDSESTSSRITITFKKLCQASACLPVNDWTRQLKSMWMRDAMPKPSLGQDLICFTFLPRCSVRQAMTPGQEGMSLALMEESHGFA